MAEQPGPERWPMSSGDVAEVFGVDARTVARWANAGRIPYVLTPGGQRRYRPEDVEKFLKPGGGQ